MGAKIRKKQMRQKKLNYSIIHNSLFKKLRIFAAELVPCYPVG